MNYRSLAVPLGLFVAACSSSPPPDTGNPKTGSTSVGSTEVNTAIAAARPDWNSELDTAHPLFIQTKPGARCNVHPQGVTSSKTGNVTADRNGKLRFLAPPQSWGANLEIDCAAGATPERTAIDLRDQSTYHLDTDLLEHQAASSTRPALTGDLQAIPREQILARGYPPRPDAKRNPQAYERWVATVSSPRVVRNVDFVAAPGHQASNYVATYDYYEDPDDGNQAWAGRAYDYYGWTDTASDPDVAVAPNANPYWYIEYNTYMLMPYSTSCTGGCAAYEWGGMGGMEALDGIADGSLIQSGIHLQSSGSQHLFVEYAPDSAYIGFSGEFSLNAGDIVETWGWLSSSDACDDYDTYKVGRVACFGFYNQTTNEYAGYNYYYIYPPYYTNYYGYTYESVMEKVLNTNLIDFGTVYLQDSAYDAAGYYHDDTWDPWIFLNGFSEQNHAVAYPSNPDSTYDDEVYYQVDWAAYH